MRKSYARPSNDPPHGGLKSEPELSDMGRQMMREAIRRQNPVATDEEIRQLRCDIDCKLSRKLEDVPLPEAQVGYMTTQEIVRRVVDALEQLSVPYMLVGSFSSNAYGVPRNTQDVDFVVQLEPTTISQLAAKLDPAFQLNPQTSFETITATIRYLLDVPVRRF